jgi:hypothetical protein
VRTELQACRGQAYIDCRVDGDVQGAFRKIEWLATAITDDGPVVDGERRCIGELQVWAEEYPYVIVRIWLTEQESPGCFLGALRRMIEVDIACLDDTLARFRPGYADEDPMTGGANMTRCIAIDDGFFWEAERAIEQADAIIAVALCEAATRASSPDVTTAAIAAAASALESKAQILAAVAEKIRLGGGK